jgi:lysophospholipase L1-like esterase
MIATRTASALFAVFCVLMTLAIGARDARGQQPGTGEKWVASWAASPHGPYPSGNPSAQPDLSLALPDRAARDQTFRLMVRPDLWGRAVRIRLTNAFGTAPVTFDGAFVGLQSQGGNVARGTNRPITFDNGKSSVTVAAGESAYSDAVTLPFVTAAGDPLLTGRRLAVSFHVAGSSGPMTWHAKALTTSYLSEPGSGARGSDENDAAFPFTTTSWYFLDAVDVIAPADAVVIACFGDSITDGTASTLNGDDRWPDVFSRRIHEKYGTRVSVVNAGIGGNRIVGPATYTPATPASGGPSALDRLERDVLSLSGVTTVIWFEGINDVANAATSEQISAGLREGVKRMRARGIRTVFAATITPTLGNAGAHGTPAADATRRSVNAFMRESGVFDGVFDFDAATIDQATGGLRAMFQPNSTTGGAGDKLHPNRAGYQAMGTAVDLDMLAPIFERK